MIPFAIRGNVAQDAVPLVVAGELARTDPDSIYAPQARDLYDLAPSFSKKACEISPPGTDCAGVDVAFVSPPQALVAAYPLSLLGLDLATLVMRVLAAACLAGGMAILWRRLAGRSRSGGIVLVFTAVLLTPFFMVSVGLGQSSPVMFASAVIGLGAIDAPWSKVAVVALVLVAAIVMKAFPVALVAVLVYKRRWRIVAAVGALLVAASAFSVLLVPVRMFSEFVSVSSTFSGFAPANPHNGAPVALAKLASEDLASGSTGWMVVMGLQFLAVGALWWFVIRRCPDADTQWAWSWVLLVFVLPMVWWHYLWVLVAGVGVALSGRRDLDDRSMLVLVGLAAATLPASLVLSTGRSIPAFQALVLIGCVAAGWWVVPRPVDHLTSAAPG